MKTLECVKFVSAAEAYHGPAESYSYLPTLLIKTGFHKLK
jgi:hypothetical protein